MNQYYYLIVEMGSVIFIELLLTFIRINYSIYIINKMYNICLNQWIYSTYHHWYIFYFTKILWPRIFFSITDIILRLRAENRIYFTYSIWLKDGVDFDAKFVPGYDNIVADHLSRFECKNNIETYQKLICMMIKLYQWILMIFWYVIDDFTNF